MFSKNDSESNQSAVSDETNCSKKAIAAEIAELEKSILHAGRFSVWEVTDRPAGEREIVNDSGE